MKKLNYVFLILLIASIAAISSQLIIVWMDSATVVSSPPIICSVVPGGVSTHSSGGGDPLPSSTIKVEWHADRLASPLELMCNGQVIAVVNPYRVEHYWDSIYGMCPRGFYRFYHSVAGYGTFTYEAEGAVNTVSVSLP